MKLIPWVKQGRNYPAVLIGRLGVSGKYRNQKIGSQIIDFKEESQEKLYNSIPADENLKTRQMYFDLATLL